MLKRVFCPPAKCGSDSASGATCGDITRFPSEARWRRIKLNQCCRYGAAVRTDAQRGDRIATEKRSHIPIAGQHRLQILVEIAQHRRQIVLECPGLDLGEVITPSRGPRRQMSANVRSLPPLSAQASDVSWAGGSRTPWPAVAAVSHPTHSARGRIDSRSRA
jgi:hypothetical protein